MRQTVRSESNERFRRASRRGFLVGATGLVATAGISSAQAHQAPVVAAADTTNVVSFFGTHQGGIVTPTQSHTYFAAFDLQASKVADIIALLRRWTHAAALLTAGLPLGSLDKGAVLADAPAPDTGEAVDLDPARLTLTFGFGAGLFVRDGFDRYGLRGKRPEALVDLPRFNGDQMVESCTGGDLSIQACADDQQVAFHAVRQLARLADGVAAIRWTQTGFSPNFGKKTPRNLMGFKDGTSNAATASPEAVNAAIWVGEDGPAWMRGGSYAVMRRIRIALEHWDHMDTPFQESTIGRKKSSGAPLTGKFETDALDLEAADADGNPVLPPTAHVRTATAAENGGALIHRRGYSYNEGVNFTAERWPPWHQGLEYNAGTFFVCYQRDPRSGFVKLFDKMSKLDAMNQFTTHVGGGLFACPPGVEAGHYVGQALFEGSAY